MGGGVGKSLKKEGSPPVSNRRRVKVPACLKGNNKKGKTKNPNP